MEVHGLSSTRSPGLSNTSGSNNDAEDFITDSESYSDSDTSSSNAPDIVVNDDDIRYRSHFRGYILPWAIVYNQPYLLRYIIKLGGPLSLIAKTPNNHEIQSYWRL